MADTSIASGEGSESGAITTVGRGGAGFYTRKATGLVRSISIWDSFIMNVAFVNIALGALTFTVAPYAFPGVDLFWTVIFTIVLTVFPTVMYAILTASMPRSGGDYVFVSRILHPSIGFVTNWNTTLWMTFFTGILCTWVAGFAGSNAFFTMGTILNSHTLLTWSARLATHGWQLGIGLATIALFTVLIAMGTRATFRVLGIIFAGMLLSQVTAVLVLLFNGHSDFVHAFARYGGGAGSYHAVLTNASKQGFHWPAGFQLGPTLGAMPFVFSSIGFGVISCYCAGEIKQVKKSSMYSMLGAATFAGLFIALFGALSQHIFGGQWLGSMSFLSSTGSKAYPLSTPPFFYLFVSMLTSNTALVAIISIGFILAVVATIPPTFLFGTRNMLAWAFDRLIPMRFANVNQRTHSPINATIAVGIFMAICMTFDIYAPSKWTAFIATAEIGSLITFSVVAICGMIFPWRRPDIYNGSPFRVSVGRIPLVTLMAVPALAFDVLLIYYLITNDALGANSTQGLVALPIMLAVPAVIYVIGRAVNRSRGVDLSVSFQELPPE